MCPRAFKKKKKTKKQRRDKMASGAGRGATVLLVCVIISSLDLCACLSSLPDPVHFSSSIIVKVSSYELTDYNVDEYLDIKGERSSLSVEDVKRAETKIYYNQLSLSGYSERKFLMYNPAGQTCKPQSVLEWPLSELRKVSIHMYSLDTLRRDLVDVPIGPSVVMYAVLENADTFKFIATTFSQARLSNVDVFGGRLDNIPVDGWRKMNMIVHLPTRNNPKDQPLVGEPLSKYLERTGNRARPVMIGACLVGDVSYSLQRTNQTADPILFEHDDQLDEATFCDKDHLRFVIRYHIVAGHQPGTLLGQSLTELGSEYLFSREPFVQPVGLGCWGSLGNSDEEAQLAPKWQRAIGRSVSMRQFSGEYVTTRGSRGVSFAAYDRERHLLRLDQHGRKSIYDLLERRSYHVGEFSAGFAGDTAAAAKGEPPKQSELVDRCVVLEMDKQIVGSPPTPLTSPMLQGGPLGGGGGGAGDERAPASLIERLIGLSQADDREHYLGTRTIDHVAYEVFEREWPLSASGEVPILLRTAKFRPSAGADKRLYLTYYARLDHQEQQQQQSSSARQEEAKPQPAQPLMIIKYVELWEFDARLKRKRIVNRLRFVEFSWSLDVEPSDDSERQTGSSSPTLRLFNVEPCYRARSRQAELVVQYKQARDSRLAKSQVEVMRSFQLEIGEHLVSLLASTIEVSRLNIVDLKLQILPSGDMVSSNRFVNLRQGLSELYELGKLELRPELGWRALVRRVWHNRHSLEDCLLDAIAWPEPNRLAFCAQSRECLILRRVKLDELKRYFVGAASGNSPGDLPSAGSASGSGEPPAAVKETKASAAPGDNVILPPPPVICTLYSHRYSTVDEAEAFRERNVADVATQMPGS